MPQNEFVPVSYKLEPETYEDIASLRLIETSGSSPFAFTFEAIRPGLFRTTFSSKTHHPLPPLPSAPKPKATDVSFQRNRIGDKKLCFETSGVLATIDWTNAPIVSLGYDQEDALHEDLPFRSYVADGTGVAHYTRYHRGSLYVGLGEKPAPMDLSNRHFVLSATDCFGCKTEGYNLM